MKEVRLAYELGKYWNWEWRVYYGDTLLLHTSSEDYAREAYERYKKNPPVFLKAPGKIFRGRLNMENNVAFSKYKLLAIDIYEWCKKHDLWGDNTIYFDGKAWSSSEVWGTKEGKKIAEDLYEYEDMNPCDYFEYANPKTLSMSFEGGLNYVLNGHTRGWVKLKKQFGKLCEKYGLYYEMGYDWNLAAYEM